MRPVAKAFVVATGLWLVSTSNQLLAQTPQTPPPAAQTPADSAAPTRKPEEGIPITDATVVKACSGCHKADEKQQLTRISFQRNTPEGWQEVIRRMAALNGLQIDSATARDVVKYLSNNLGLAPDEAKPAAFEVERRLPDYKYTASADAEAVCAKCHSMGRVISQRRNRDEWNLLIAMHRGWYPLVDNQAFRSGGGRGGRGGAAADGQPRDNRQPVEKAVAHLSSAFPLITPEWTAWSATMRPARIEGTWTLSATEVGKGDVYGRMIVTPVAATPDEFTTEITYTYARTGAKVTRSGRSIVYTGFQWRGRSTEGTGDARVLREVMFVDRDWRAIQGRWFTGGYDEIGLDVTLRRLGADPLVLGSDRTALQAGVNGQELKIYGANLPASLQPSQIDPGPGITVARVIAVTPEMATIAVDVAANAAVGSRDLFVAGASRPKALAVYDRIDGIKVTPAWAMARVGGVTFPKGLAQYEARAFVNGTDKQPDTADDIDLGVVDAAWSLEEFAATYDDDDIKFVGEIDKATGRFTPSVEGPNTARKGHRNNIGDVYVVATYTPPAAAAGKPVKPLRARAHLLVTVPLYMRWENPGASQ